MVRCRARPLVLALSARETSAWATSYAKFASMMSTSRSTSCTRPVPIGGRPPERGAGFRDDRPCSASAIGEYFGNFIPPLFFTRNGCDAVPWALGALLSHASPVDVVY